MKYKVLLTTTVNSKTLKKGSGILVLEPDDYTKTAIKKIKAKGYKVLGYLSVGTIEKERSWYKKYKKYGLECLEDWPNEVYADVRKQAWRDFVVKRAKAIKDKGFDGWWCDNLDVYEYYKSSEMFSACYLVLKDIKRIDGYLMVNGGCKFFERLIKSGKPNEIVNGYTQEEVFSLIVSYSDKGEFSKQKKTQRELYQNVLRRLKAKGVDIFLLEYTRDSSLKTKIRKWCAVNHASCYISEDVDL